MARRRRHEEHEHHEAWAIPYGDLVTLLLAFFVVMYSISSVNAGKYRVVSASLTAAFGGTPRAPQDDTDSAALQAGDQTAPVTLARRLIADGLPDHGLLAGSSAQTPARTAPAEAAAPGESPFPPVSLAKLAPPPASTPSTGPGDAQDQQEQQELDQVTGDVTDALKALIVAGQVRVRRYGSWLAVDISTDILFGSGVARLSPQAMGALERLSAALAPWPNMVRVEGHTDDRPISTPEFRSNWELSAARAASVVHLFMDHGIAPERLAVVGFGQYRPSMPNGTAAGRNANRRVAIVILGRDAAPEAGM